MRSKSDTFGQKSNITGTNQRRRATEKSNSTAEAIVAKNLNIRL